DIARRVHRLTAILATGLRELGHAVEQTHFFDTLSIASGADTAVLFERALEEEINLREIGGQRLGISLDETSTPALVQRLWAVSAHDGHRLPDFAALADTPDPLPGSLLRQSHFLEHPVFNRYHSETELMRYLRRLADKDLALDRSMIPLGSCTMKLNAASEMLP